MYFVAHRNLILDFLQSVLYAEVSLIHQAVRIYDMAQDTLGNLMLVLEYHRIDTVIFCRITVHNNIRRYVFRDAATCLNQYPTADVAILMQDNVTAQDCTVVYAAVACHRALNSQYAVIAYLHVVAEVNTVH